MDTFQGMRFFSVLLSVVNAENAERQWRLGFGVWGLGSGVSDVVNAENAERQWRPAPAAICSNSRDFSRERGERRKAMEARGGASGEPLGSAAAVDAEKAERQRSS